MEAPGVQPVEDGEEDPLVRAEDPAQRAVEEQEGGDMGEQDEDGRRPVLR